MRRSFRRASQASSALGLVAVTLALSALAAPPATTQVANAGSGLADVSARPLIARPSVLWYPGFARDAELRGAWVRALGHEREDDYLAAARIFESLIERAPEEPHTYWRIARDYAWLAELEPPSASRLRTRYANLAIGAGHAMMGISLGPVTGCLLAEILAGETPRIDLSQLSPDRYDRR